MPQKIESPSILEDCQVAGAAEAAEFSRAKVDLLDRRLRETISQRDGFAIETSVLKGHAETLAPEVSRMRGELLQLQEEIERLKAGAVPQSSVDSATSDAILVFISKRQNPSLRGIASRFGLGEKEARSTLDKLQRSGLVSPLNLQNGVQRWILVKKGAQYLQDRGLMNQTFRQRVPSRVYWQ